MTAADSAPLRPGEELNVPALAAYLAGKLDGVSQGLTVEQFPGGHSNLTYLLKTPARDYVLRRAPLGPVPPKAHDMAREYSFLEAVHPAFPPAPRVFHLCLDPSIIGAVFFVMERRRGLVLRDRVPPEFEAQPDYRARIGAALVDCLVQLHRVDLPRHNLLGLGKPEGFLERQIRGWADRWSRSRTEPIPAMDSLADWLAARMPASQPPTLLHNDFKLDNVMLDASNPSRVEAVLDWEMSAIGDPLVDLGVALCYWSPPTALGPVTCLTSGPGWLTPAEFIARYAAGTGFDVSRASYYQVFAVFKLAVVIQQIFFRFHMGQTRDERFRHFNERVRALALAGWEMARQD